MTAGVPWSVDRRPALDAPRLDLREDFGCAILLLLLSRRAADRHELGAQLQRLGQPDDLQMIGHALLALQVGGLVCVVGDARGADPRRGETYGLTREGLEQVGLAAEALRETLVMLGRFLARCGERLDLVPRA